MPLSSVAAVERYFAALKEKNLGTAPFAPDVVFEGPLSPRLAGAEAVKEFLNGMLTAIRDIRVHRHIVDGDHVATIFELETAFGVIPICDTFHVVNGQLKQIRPFYDPRPIVEGMAQQAQPTA